MRALWKELKASTLKNHHMPNIARVQLDGSVGHSGTPDPLRKFGIGSNNVFLNGKSIVRIGDLTLCGDTAQGGSSSVFVNGIGVHRKDDTILSHDNTTILCESGSENTFAG